MASPTLRPPPAASRWLGDGPGVPPNVAHVPKSHLDQPISTLALFFEVLDDRPDWPVVGVRVDGQDPFAAVASPWHGFDPEKILGPQSPLLPREPGGRRVAVYRCSCGEAGCGVMAPVIVASPDRSRVSWVDFRDYTGVFIDPVADDVDTYEGREWGLPDLHFDRRQYEAEVNRIAGDPGWETDRRRTARLVRERLRPMSLTLPPDLTLSWVSPAWSEEGVSIMFAHITWGERPSVQQQMLQLASQHQDPVVAADDIVDRLLATSVDDWVAAFGHDPR